MVSQTKALNGSRFSQNQFSANTVQEMLETALIMRRGLASQFFNNGRNIAGECGYPQIVSPRQYREMYEREGVATRVVQVYPEESWAMDPCIYEQEDQTESEFETAWAELNETTPIVPMMYAADEVSGIGHFGLLLYGISDGQALNTPAPGLDATGAAVPTDPGLKLLYTRVFDESLVQIKEFEKDEQNPRFGLPTMYRITFADPAVGMQSGAGMQLTDREVHWTRLEHIADNRKTSPVWGTPRQRPVFNRLYDLLKVLGGSGEMFWKGGFPGTVFETYPELGDVVIDKASLKKEFQEYQNGLQRFMALQGMQAKSLSPQVASPTDHYDIQMRAIALTLGVPLRVFMGSEEAKLSSSQDAQTWNKRLARRQNKYITPYIVQPVVNRLVAYGILPKPKKIMVHWPDLNTSTDEEKASTAAKRTTALATYVGGGVEQLVTPHDFFVHILNMPEDVAEEIIDNATNHVATLEIPGAEDVPSQDSSQPKKPKVPGQKAAAPSKPKPKAGLKGAKRV